MKKQIIPIILSLIISVLAASTVNAVSPVNTLCSCQACRGEQIRITIPEGTYINNNPNAWLEESSVYFANYSANKWYNFHLTIENTLNSPVNVTLVIAIPKTTTTNDLASITMGGGELGSLIYYLSSFGNKSFCGTPHGVYPPAGNAIWAFYPVGNIPANTAKNLTVKVTLGPNPSAGFKVHFDLNASQGNPNCQIHNPNSKDATFTYCNNCGDPGIPEFSSIIVPITLSLASIGIFLSKRKL